MIIVDIRDGKQSTCRLHVHRHTRRIIPQSHSAGDAGAGDRAWFRFALMWTVASTGETCTWAGMQLYRVDGGKLAETWLMLHKLGSAWPDAAGQEHWTSKRAYRR